MTNWARIDVGFLRNPKVNRLPTSDKVAYLAGILHAAEFRTDGVISATCARTIANRWQRDRLVAAGLWHPNGDGYLIHGYLDHQPSRADLEAEADRRARGLAQARERQRRHRTSGDP